MCKMYICPVCKNTTNLPVCFFCGYKFIMSDGVYILSNDPDINIDNESKDKYIGYEHIGEFYSGKKWYEITDRQHITGKVIAEIAGDGIMLDLACGDGNITVPTAKYGCRIIAADISNKMLSLLFRKAKYNRISMENVIVCRMNALDIPIADNSFDYVIANSVMHLISNPYKVLTEIKRVLRPGGKYISLDDEPGKQDMIETEPNMKYIEVLNNFYKRYWECMKQANILPKKYSWKFDKAKICEENFCNKTSFKIEYNKEYTVTLEDGMLYRMRGRGFSDQADVPEKIHNRIFRQTVKEFMVKYGNDFTEISYTGKEDNIKIDLFEKYRGTTL